MIFASASALSLSQTAGAERDIQVADYDYPRRLFAEFIGTAFLLATVVGSGIMAEALAGGNVAIALLGNTIATGAVLVVLITMLGPISGAHFNPAVTLVFALKKDISIGDSFGYVVVQIVGGLLGLRRLVWCSRFWQRSRRGKVLSP